MLWDPAVTKAVHGAARARLGDVSDHADPLGYIERWSEWQSFGIDVIYRYEREKRERGWLGWYHRWKGGGA